MAMEDTRSMAASVAAAFGIASASASALTSFVAVVGLPSVVVAAVASAWAFLGEGCQPDELVQLEAALALLGLLTLLCMHV